MYLERSPSSSSSSSPSDSLSSTSFRIDAGPTGFPLYFFFLRPNSSYSPSDSSRSIYSTFSRSLNPPPYPVRSSNLAYFGVLHILHSDLLAQFTLPHVLHCQSLALKRPRLFSARVFPISVPPAFIILASVVFSLPQRLQLVLLAKFTFPHFLSGQIQSPSLTRKFLVDISDPQSPAERRRRRRAGGRGPGPCAGRAARGACAPRPQRAGLAPGGISVRQRLGRLSPAARRGCGERAPPAARRAACSSRRARGPREASSAGAGSGGGRPRQLGSSAVRHLSLRARGSRRDGAPG